MVGKRSFNINGAECGVEALILGVAASMGGFLFGFDTGQISGVMLFDDFRSRFSRPDSEGGTEWQPLIQSLIVSLMSIGCLIGALSCAYTADWWGRRKSMCLGVAMYILGNIIQITVTTSWIHMTIGRFVTGLGIGNMSVGVPMFQSECAPREIRGAVVASYQLLITFGILVANIINYWVHTMPGSGPWRTVIRIGMCSAIPIGLGILTVPESPRWLAAKKDWEGARMSLARLRGMTHDPNHSIVEDDINEMRAILEKEHQAGTGSWAECFRSNKNVPKLVYRTFLGMAIHFFQQWTGVNYFFYYGATIFESAGVRDPILTQLILGAVNFLTTLYGLYVVERFGRRWPLFLGALWQAAWLLIFATVGSANDVEVPNKPLGIVLIVSACMFIASFAGTWGPMTWVVIGETFPLRTRAKQASIATASNWFGNFLLGFLTPLATQSIGYSYGFVFFVTNLLAATVVWYFLYESRTLSLENIDLMYADQGLKAWTSHEWVPPGYITRRQRDAGHFRRMSIIFQSQDKSMYSERNVSTECPCP